MRALPSVAGWGAMAVLAAAMVRADEARAEGPPVSADGASEGCLGERFVILKLDDDFDPALGEEVRTDLTTDLAHRGLGLCSLGSTSRPPEAIVTLREQESMVVVIELDDLVTHKRVERDLSVQKIPANGRALAIAIAIDELLRASWAELTLERSWQADRDEADEDRSEGETDARSAPRAIRSRKRIKTRVELGAALGFAHTAREFDAFSLHGRLSLRVWEFGWSQLELGALASRPAQGETGEALAVGVASALTLGGCSRAKPPLFACAGARGGVDLVSLHGVRPSMARTRREQAVVTHASLVTLLAAPLTTRAHLFGELGLGAVLKGVAATDGTRTLMDISGLLLSLRVGVGVAL